MALRMSVGQTFLGLLEAAPATAWRGRWWASPPGSGAAVVLLVTAASLPALWRLTRPDGIRTE